MAELTTRLRPVWLASYPRSGNTFLRIILQNMFRLPTYSLYRVEGTEAYDPSADALDEAPYLPRNWRELISESPDAKLTLIKTHDAPEGQAPAIYVVRDGRGTVDSYFHYHKKFAFEQPSLTEIIAGACQFGSWSEHYLAWRPQTRPNTLLLRYEDLVAQPAEAISRIAAFLKVEPSEGRLPTFDELKTRLPAFFRRGQNEDYLTQWTPGQIAFFNHLHSQVMAELGYPITPSAESGESVLAELAKSAARLHKLYLEQLKLQGSAVAAHKQVTHLSEQLAARTLERQELLCHRWTRLGIALRLMPKATGNPVIGLS